MLFYGRHASHVDVRQGQQRVMARSPLRRKLEVGSGERVRACVVTLLFVNLRLVDSKIIAQFFLINRARHQVFGYYACQWLLHIEFPFKASITQPPRFPATAYTPTRSLPSRVGEGLLPRLWVSLSMPARSKLNLPFFDGLAMSGGGKT